MMDDDVENLSGDLDTKNLLPSPSKDLKERLMALNLSSPAAVEWLTNRRQNIRSWTTFLNASRFKAPMNVGHCSLRIAKNLDYFQSNYIFVFLGLVIYCFVTSPLLLLTLAATGAACYIVRQKNVDRKIRILGHELTPVHQYALVVLCAMPFFLIAGAGSAVFWIIGASFVLIMVHATFFAFETLHVEEEFALQMEAV